MYEMAFISYLNIVLLHVLFGSDVVMFVDVVWNQAMS